MAEFTPITIESQEQLDGMFKDRLNRQNEKHSRELAELRTQYQDYDELKEANSGYQSQIEQLTSQLSEVNEKVKGYDSVIAEKDATISQYRLNALKSSVLAEMNLPSDAINFIQGTDEESIRQCAESLKTLVGAGHHVAPLAAYEPKSTDSRNDALRSMLQGL